MDDYVAARADRALESFDKALEWQIGRKLSRMFVGGEGRGLRKVPKPQSAASKLRRTENAIYSQRTAESTKTAAALKQRRAYVDSQRATRAQANERRRASGLSTRATTPWPR